MTVSLLNDIKQAVADLYAVEAEITISRTEPQFGDYACNVAMQLAGKLKQPPRVIAETIANALKDTPSVESISVAGPGFLNIKLNDTVIADMLHKAAEVPRLLAGRVIVAEYSDPNPFKVLHAGHLYTSVVGDAVANVLEAAGAEVHRVNFGGDVGLHVGKTMWAILQELGGEHPQKLNDIPASERSEWMAAAYVRGTQAYEEDEAAKAAIIELNKKIYSINANEDKTSDLAQIYWTCRQWSYDYFDAFYARIGTVFERYYPESTVAGLGLATVKEQLKNGIFTESNGAVVFEGEQFGLHTRVFINGEGLPTYEAKDVGLLMQKKRDYNFDTSFVITGNEQEQYMTVVLKAIEQFAPELAHATKHLTHGIVKLAGGVKMSSRKGNFLRAVDVLDTAAEANKNATGSAEDDVVLGAVKYALLKQRMGGDIVYDPEDSISIIGNSGPYLQYAYARARSIIKKASVAAATSVDFGEQERLLALKISELPEVIEKVLQEYMPHHICTYLYELTQVFNRFYEKEKVIGSKNEAEKIALLNSYTEVLKTGLGLLGIAAPESM